MADFPDPGIPSMLMMDGRCGKPSCEARPPVFHIIGVKGYSSSSLFSSLGHTAEVPDDLRGLA